MPTILLVDDEPYILWLFQILLEDLGHRVFLSEDGEEALRKAIERKPDLIVTDCNMPGLDGVELCRRLKASAVTAQIPVIMVSASRPPQGEKLWNVFLSKPVDLDTFDTNVKSLLAHRVSVSSVVLLASTLP